MITLQALQPGLALIGVEPAVVVTVIAVVTIGDGAV